MAKSGLPILYVDPASPTPTQEQLDRLHLDNCRQLVQDKITEAFFLDLKSLWPERFERTPNDTADVLRYALTRSPIPLPPPAIADRDPSRNLLLLCP